MARENTVDGRVLSYYYSVEGGVESGVESGMGARRVVVPVVATILLVASTASTTRSIEAANRSRDRRAQGGHPGSWTQGRGQVVSSRMLGEEEIVEVLRRLRQNPLLHVDDPQHNITTATRRTLQVGGEQVACMDTGFVCDPNNPTHQGTDYCQSWAYDSICQRGRCVQPALCAAAGSGGGDAMGMLVMGNGHKDGDGVDRTGWYLRIPDQTCNMRPVYQRGDNLVLYQPTGHIGTWLLGDAIEASLCRWSGSTSWMYAYGCGDGPSPAACPDGEWQQNFEQGWHTTSSFVVEAHHHGWPDEETIPEPLPAAPSPPPSSVATPPLPVGTDEDADTHWWLIPQIMLVIAASAVLITGSIVCVYRDGYRLCTVILGIAGASVPLYCLDLQNVNAFRVVGDVLHNFAVVCIVAKVVYQRSVAGVLQHVMHSH